MNIQWYPGHMTKTKRMILANLSLVDIVIELLDARIPYSSKNPDIDEFAKSKKRLILLNKSDLADEHTTNLWKDYYKARDFHILAVNSKDGKIAANLSELVRTVMKDKIAQQKSRGRLTVSIRAMVVGIPNVGKSTLINSLSLMSKRGGKPTATADRPGVTRGKQWVKVANDFDLLDTPGVLWPKFEDPNVAENLAFTGALNDNILDNVTLATIFLERIATSRPQSLLDRYKLDEITDSQKLLESIAMKRGFKLKGNIPNLERAAITVLDEFRAGLLGRISLEKP
ncbi:MAG: ribosome biogenesis GTPase YlqF [Turicibacter sp.]|nr:ribosome biogenesis GTPase YlqF [Turicibacter sp.]